VTRLRRGIGVLVVALTGLVVLAGCGIPRDDAPRVVPTGEIDPRLLAQPSPTQTPSPTGASAYQVAFVIGGNRLALTPRAVSPTPALQQVQQLLDTLAAGPDDAEHARGLSTALPPDARLTITALNQGEAVVAMDGVTKDADPHRLPLSVAQVVLTVTSHPDVHAVRITSDGQPVEPPLPGGYIVHGALRASDYASFLAPRATPSPTRSR
jgi:hypothetical protein